MKTFVATYSMGGIATGGFFKSIVAAYKKENVKGLLNEMQGEDVSNLYIEIRNNKSTCKFEQVLATSIA
jgi:hypothetical protein